MDHLSSGSGGALQRGIEFLNLGVYAQWRPNHAKGNLDQSLLKVKYLDREA